MAIRITQNQATIGYSGNLQSIYAQLSKSNQQLSDGKRITKPSDDPFGTGQTINYDAQLSDVHQFQTNVSNAQGFLSSADAALDSATQALQRIKQLALTAANGTLSSQDLQNTASEMTQLKEVVRDSMNAQHGDQYIFGGTATANPPYPAPGNAYAGTLTVLTSQVAPTQNVQLSAPGEIVVGINPAPGNVFDDIDALILAVQAGNSNNIQTTAATVVTDTDRVINVRAQLGATASRLESTLSRLNGQEERLIDARSKVAEVDSTEAVMNFSKQQTMYQAALAAGTKMMKTTILDYI
jgi:flagellar hook-associated protein 3 FlgL